MRTFIAITLLTILFPISGLSQTKPTFPTGWRAAANSDYSAENLSFFKNQAPSHVEADFNGDGLNDVAWILLKRNEKQFGLFVFLGNRDGGFNLINLIEYQKETDKLYMGISLMTPGKKRGRFSLWAFKEVTGAKGLK